MIEQIAAWQTSDGRVFDSEQKALAHDNVCEFKRWCAANICRGGEWTAAMVAEAILEEFVVQRRLDGEK